MTAPLKDSLLNIARIMMQHIIDSTATIQANHRRNKELGEAIDGHRQTYYAAKTLLSALGELEIPNLTDELDEIPF